jgi:hypothetical protein
LVPDWERLNALPDFEKPVEEDLRVRELEVLVVEHGLQWLHAVSTSTPRKASCAG